MLASDHRDPLSLAITLILMPMSAASPIPVAPPSTGAGFADGPRLLADIGGTNARFAIESAPGQLGQVQVLSCNSYRTLFDALRAYLASLEQVAAAPRAIAHAAIAIANPVD